MSDSSDARVDEAQEEGVTTLEDEHDQLDLSPDNESDRQSFTRSRPFDAFDESIEPAPPLNGTNFQGYKGITASDDEEEKTAPATPIRWAMRDELMSPDDTASNEDDLPSVRPSILSSPRSSRAPSQLSVQRAHRPGALQPFDRRFSARPSLSPQSSSRNGSPAFLHTHSRQSSLASTLFQSSQDGSEPPQAPWEVVRWTKLRKISGLMFSEVGKRNYGKPTAIAVAASIIVGTSKGLTLVFDYQQQLTATIGIGTKAVESGGVTAVAVSADHSTIACAHASGNIFTWEIARPAKPFLHISPIDAPIGSQRRSDGHVTDTPIVHVGFLGMRRTALVSADLGGMCFSHLATRGLGAVTRSVKTTRLLGRYPVPTAATNKPRKPSSVFAFSPLPLGNIEQPTDALGLTAMLTPYLLVVVSTTPVAETQFKVARPKEIAPHSALSGCLAWFPAVKLKHPTKQTQADVSRTKLAYSWSNILTILDVEVEPSEEKDKPPVLHFKPRSRWKSDEAIVAIQWLHRSVLGILTISQRLLIVEDIGQLRMTDSFDLLNKHIYHQDLFSEQLESAVEQLDEQDQSMHGVVADAFHMSFRSYKGRLFLLGFDDVSIGTLSNWADRLLALMEEGDFIAAIQLATTYYQGTADKISVGLPEDDAARHALVQEKLIDMMTASIRYIFNGEALEDADYSERQSRLKELASTSFVACTVMNDTHFLFDTVYEAYENESFQSVFFEVLEPYVLDKEIVTIPPNVLKDMITYYAALGRDARLQEMICELDTKTLDLNQVTGLCKDHMLFDALIYVWNQAIGDYVTPMVELLNLIRQIVGDDDVFGKDQSQHFNAAMKLFPYLAYIFTGKVFPSGLDRPPAEAYDAKEQVYRFLFSGRIQDWPAGSGRHFHTMADPDDEPAYPYLSLVLQFDTPAFMSVLNEAFEDDFLNGSHDLANDNTWNGRPKSRNAAPLPTRQTIIGMLMDVLSTDIFTAADSIYFDMFVARNLPKFPQFIILPGAALHAVLEHLCDFPSEDMAQDCQLSVEYLLSFYHPSDLSKLIPMFKEAGFYRVLKGVYRGARMWPELLRVYLEDPDDRLETFDCLRDCLRPGAEITTKQAKEVSTIIVDGAVPLASIDIVKFVQTLQTYAMSLITPVLTAMAPQPQFQYSFLKALLEPSSGERSTSITEDDTRILDEQYVQLMCRFDSGHVAGYITVMSTGDLKLDEVLPAMEQSGVIDAAVILMTREGLVSDAMKRLVQHLHTLQLAFVSLIDTAAESPDEINALEAAEDLLQAVQKYSKVGIWLCQGETKRGEVSGRWQQPDRKPFSIGVAQDDEANLMPDELLWLDLLDSIVMLTQDTAKALDDFEGLECPLDITHISTTLKSTVQQVFTALLTSTSRPTMGPNSLMSPISPSFPSTLHGANQQPSFLRIFRAFLTRASTSSPSLSHLRTALTNIFSAFTFEETILKLATQFLDKDLFIQVDRAYTLRQRGWRPKGNTCEGCGRRAWGPGAGGEIWEEWEANRRAEEGDRLNQRRRSIQHLQEQQTLERKGRGKAKAMPNESGRFTPVTRSPSHTRGPYTLDGDKGADSTVKEATTGSSAAGTAPSKPDLGPLIVFACRHIWHQTCLEISMDATERFVGWRLKKDGNGDPRCPLEED